MPKISIEDLKKIKERVKADNALRDGGHRVKVTVHLGTCGVAAGARTVMDTLMSEVSEANVTDVAVTTTGCGGFCSKEPLVTVEILGGQPVLYGQMDANKMRQVFRRHVLQGEVQSQFAIARG